MGKDLSAAAAARQANAVGGPRKRLAFVGNLQRVKTRVRGGDLGHLLIDRNRVAIRRSQLAAGEPDFLAVVVVTQPARMMQAADWRDHVAMLLQRLERARKSVALARRGDLVIERVDAVGNVNEHTAARLKVRCLGLGGHHAVEQRQRNKAAHAAQGGAAVNQPGSGLYVTHDFSLAFLKQVGDSDGPDNVLQTILSALRFFNNGLDGLAIVDR